MSWKLQTPSQPAAYHQPGTLTQTDFMGIAQQVGKTNRGIGLSRFCPDFDYQALMQTLILKAVTTESEDIFD